MDTKIPFRRLNGTTANITNVNKSLIPVVTAEGMQRYPETYLPDARDVLVFDMCRIIIVVYNIKCCFTLVIKASN